MLQGYQYYGMGVADSLWEIIIRMLELEHCDRVKKKPKEWGNPPPPNIERERDLFHQFL